MFRSLNTQSGLILVITTGSVVFLYSLWAILSFSSCFQRFKRAVMETNKTALGNRQTSQTSQSGAMQCYPLRVCPGEELKSTLAQFVRNRGLESAFIITCVGSVVKAHLRMANTTETKLYDQGPYEIVSLVGTLSGGTAGHLHTSLSDAQGVVVGGHVMGQMIVHTTAEVMIGNVTGVVFTREPDSRTGFDELCVN